MSKILIKTADYEKYLVNGRLSFNVAKTEDGFLITGQFMTHSFIEDIKIIETDRYVLNDIEVLSESFGSEDYDILYSFKAEDYEVKGGITNLEEDYIQKIEDELYKDAESNKWKEGVIEEWKLKKK